MAMPPLLLILDPANFGQPRAHQSDPTVKSAAHFDVSGTAATPSLFLRLKNHARRLEELLFEPDLFRRPGPGTYWAKRTSGGKPTTAGLYLAEATFVHYPAHGLNNNWGAGDRDCDLDDIELEEPRELDWKWVDVDFLDGHRTNRKQNATPAVSVEQSPTGVATRAGASCDGNFSLIYTI
eukprot:scaffold35243_cov37-Cyclotella_meneghiniana.AAC.2